MQYSDMTDIKYAEELRDDKIYSLKDFIAVLNSHGFPGSPYWIKQIEKEGFVNPSVLPTSNSIKSSKIYTGEQIKSCIKKLVDSVQNSKVRK